MPASKRFSPPVGHAGLALESRVADLRFRLDLVSPTLLAERTGTNYLELGQGRGEYHIQFLGESIILTHPNYCAVKISGEQLPVIKQALLLYYFDTCDGSDPTGSWVSFAGLPDGRVYSSAFQGYAGDAIARRFGMNLAGFCAACEAMNAFPLSSGDAGYRFLALPKISIAVIYHLGDEDFPSNCHLLFDENTQHCLPAEACAILGNMLAHKIIEAHSKGV